MLLEVVAEVDVRIGCNLAEKAISASIVISDGFGLLEVLVSFLVDFSYGWVCRVSTDQHINNDIFLVVDDFLALLYGRPEVDVVNHTSIKEDIPVKVLRREDARKGARGDGGLGKVLKRSVLLSHRDVFTSVSVDCTHYEPPCDLTFVFSEGVHGFQSYRVI